MQNLAVLGIAINADMYNKLKVSMYGRLPYKHANCLWYENDNCHRIDLTFLMAVRVPVLGNPLKITASNILVLFSK